MSINGDHCAHYDHPPRESKGRDPPRREKRGQAYPARHTHGLSHAGSGLLQSKRGAREQRGQTQRCRQSTLEERDGQIGHGPRDWHIPWRGLALGLLLAPDGDMGALRGGRWLKLFETGSLCRGCACSAVIAAATQPCRASPQALCLRLQCPCVHVSAMPAIAGPSPRRCRDPWRAGVKNRPDATLPRQSVLDAE